MTEIVVLGPRDGVRAERIDNAVATVSVDQDRETLTQTTKNEGWGIKEDQIPS
jgi:hypothetical protein